MPSNRTEKMFLLEGIKRRNQFWPSAFWMEIIPSNQTTTKPEPEPSDKKFSPPNLFKLNLVFATLQLTQLVALQRD
jgi:hypothetical protein